MTWSGDHRAPINNLGVYPRPAQERLPVWIAVGGTPQSVTRAGTLGLPLALAIIGGEPARFAPLVDLYRQAGQNETTLEPAAIEMAAIKARKSKRQKWVHPAIRIRPLPSG